MRTVHWKEAGSSQKQDIAAALAQWKAAERYFESVQESDLMDYAIYQMEVLAGSILKPCACRAFLRCSPGEFPREQNALCPACNVSQNEL